MLTRLETSSLLRVMLGVFEADRCMSRPFFSQRMLLICIQLRRHPNCTVATCSTISAVISAKRSNTITMNNAAQRNISVELPTITTFHLDKRWLMPVMQACDETWMATGDILTAWLAAADKAVEMNIQIQAGEQTPGVCTCNIDATRAVTPHPCSACGRTLICKAMVVSGLGLMSCKACKRKDDKRSGGSVPEIRVRRGVTSRLKKKCEMAGWKAGSAEHELATVSKPFESTSPASLPKPITTIRLPIPTSTPCKTSNSTFWLVKRNLWTAAVMRSGRS